MNERSRKKMLAMLRVLKAAANQPMSGADIQKALQLEGIEISERSVRLYLEHTDKEKLTASLGRRGRLLTEHGLHELGSAHIIERLGFLSARIDQMTFRMTFDLATRTGTVVVNTTLVQPRQLARHAGAISKVYEKGYAMGTQMALLKPGERCGDFAVPEGHVGLATVCSITLNGVLLKAGIPVHSRFGGLLELRRGEPIRFVEVITYEGSTIDPLEVFIRSGMTNYLGAIAKGDGRIGAGFREIPAESRERVTDLARRLHQAGLGGFLQIGRPGQPLLEIPVSEGMAGAVVIGGLNPAAIFEEKGERVFSRALSGLIEFERLFHYTELRSRLVDFI
jgi:repressor of nif and glnA expression